MIMPEKLLVLKNKILNKAQSLWKIDWTDSEVYRKMIEVVPAADQILAASPMICTDEYTDAELQHTYTLLKDIGYQQELSVEDL